MTTTDQAEIRQTANLNIVGNPDAEIIIVCDAPSKGAWERKFAMAPYQLNYFA